MSSILFIGFCDNRQSSQNQHSPVFGFMRTLLRKLPVAGIFLAFASAVVAQDDATQFARIVKDSQGRSSALQTAVVTYVPRGRPDELSVDLVSAIHIADKSYYDELNSRFQTYDVLLYELVMPEGGAVSQQPSNGKGFLSSAQLMLGNFLDLSFQLDQVDYSAANFVHADLSPRELQQSMIERNETLYDYFWRLYFAAMQDYASDPLGVDDLATLLTSGNGYDIKTVLAYELVKISKAGDILAGESGSAVISGRNERALEVLRLQIASRNKRIGIFYGAAHLPDMERRLRSEFGFIRHKTVWIDAWLLGERPARATPD